MFDLIIENEHGEQLEITQSSDYVVTLLEGLSPAAADIITAPVAAFDGEKFKKSKVQKRNITMTVVFRGNIEASRIGLYTYIKPKHYIKLYYENGLRDTWIEGYVESCEIGFFEQRQAANISIICPDPYFKDVESTKGKLSDVANSFSFPFWANDANKISFGTKTTDTQILLTNKSDVDVGFTWVCLFNGYCENPILYDVDTEQWMKIDYSFLLNDELRVTTLDGKKSIYLIHRGAEINLINYIVPGSSWLKLAAGYNHLTQNADTGAENMETHIEFTNNYEGV